MSSDLKHSGTPRHSGRYPWGSGSEPYQRDGDFPGYINSLKKEGLSDVEIANSLGINTTKLRILKGLATQEKRASNAAMALRLEAKGYSHVAIGKRMGGINESSVRAMLKPGYLDKAHITKTIAGVLRDAVENQGMIDVGIGVEKHLNTSRTKLKSSVALLKEEGYTLHEFRVNQLGTDKKTTYLVLAKPGVTDKEVFANRLSVGLPFGKYLEDGGRIAKPILPPISISSDRIQIRDAKEGGSDKDGVIEIRRGVEDLSLGAARYAQVRIAVDGTHYIKGMAMYSDHLPDGVDVLFNSSKNMVSSKLDVLKPMTADIERPFGAEVRQKEYTDAKGKTKLSPLNIVNEEGDWTTWNKTISSQMLSKQSPSLAKKQLGFSLKDKQDEYNEIMALTNPIVQKKLLKTFSDSLDSATADLDGFGMPRQAWHVILPITTLKPNEIYAPHYKNGEPVVLIRYPHGGTFEIPDLVINNNNPLAKSVMHNAKDAIGIHPDVAKRISGADFDGDTVLVIPNPHGAIKSSSPLKGLVDFEPRQSYKGFPGMPVMSEQAKGLHMGNISNLITDMTIKGANPSELARAVRHSMVVIDAHNHKLNYKQSYLDNNIDDLKIKYQGGSNRGASTIVSRSGATARVPYRSSTFRIDRKTGKKIYELITPTYTNKAGEVLPRRVTYSNKKGKVLPILTKSRKMLEVDDAFSLSSGTVMESVYATYANKLKGLANDARKSMYALKTRYYSPSAKKTYAEEVAALDAKINLALSNKPLERRAQLIGNAAYAAKRRALPDIEKSEWPKIKGQELLKARNHVGAQKHVIDVTPKEWEAIQAGAISNHALSQIMENMDTRQLKMLATPRTRSGSIVITSAKLARGRSMLNSGYTQAEVADALGVSTSTIEEQFG